MTVIVSPTDYSPLKRLALLPDGERARRLAELAAKAEVTVEQVMAAIVHDWLWVGRPKQQPPDWAWTFWLILAGRGFGKTLTGAQWVKKMIEEPFTGKRGPDGETWRVALVGPTLMDVRQTMVEGESGLLSVLPPRMLRGGTRQTAWNRSTVELYLANGTHIRGFSSEVPDRLRGWQQHFAWGDELSSWNDANLGDKLETTYSNLKLSTRLGDHPRFCFTTTPKPNKLTKEIVAMKRGLAVVRGSSYENRDNLAEAWWNEVVAPLEGTRTGKQEILAMILADVEGALWTLANIETQRLRHEEPHALGERLARTVVAVDPNVSSGEGANEAGIVVCATDNAPGNARKGYVLADRSTGGGPRQWAQDAVAAYHEFKADRIVAEKNNGGEMVELTLHTVDANVPVKLVNAAKGKRPRAEPVSALYTGSDTVKPRVFHVGAFPELEEQMTTWTPESESPDRMDALVWGLTELMLGPSGTMTSHVPKGRRIDQRMGIVR